jgi:hypothetical protein
VAVEQVKRDAPRTGQTGNSVAQTFDVVQREFEAAVKAVLGKLQRVLTNTSLDRSELRELVVQHLMNFAVAAKPVAERDRINRSCDRRD